MPKNIFLHQNAFGRTVLNADNSITAGFAPGGARAALHLQPEGRCAYGAWVDEAGRILLSQGKDDTYVMDASEIKIPGAINVENYLAAICAVWGDVPIDIIRVVAATSAAWSTAPNWCASWTA